MKEYDYSPLSGNLMAPGYEGRDPAWWDKNFPGSAFVFNPFTGRKRKQCFVGVNPRGPANWHAAPVVPPHAEDRLLPAVAAALSPASQHEYETVRAAVANAKTMILSADAAERKGMVITTGVLDYFPLALAEVARVSKAGNDQHNPGQPLHWDKTKSMDHADCIARHLIDRGTRDSDGQRHSAKLAWRALANLQIELENEEKGQA